MNRLADIDAGWWPFLRLRPARHEVMDNRLLARQALHFGPLYGLAVFAYYAAIGFMPLSALSAAICVAAAAAFFFVVARCTFAVFWNRRARRLQAAGDAGRGAPE